MCTMWHNTTPHGTQNYHVGQMCLFVQFYTNLNVYLYISKVKGQSYRLKSVKSCL